MHLGKIANTKCIFSSLLNDKMYPKSNKQDSKEVVSALLTEQIVKTQMHLSKIDNQICPLK